VSVLVFIIFSVVFVTDIADCLSDFVHTSDSWHHVVYVCKCTVRDICCVTGNLFFLNCSQIPQVLEAIVKLIQQEGSVSTVCDMSDEHVGALQQ